MSRSARVLIDNIAYHVIARGNQRQTVLKCEEDFNRYLKILQKYKNKFKAKLYAYCLMSNHVHLVVDPADKALLNKMMHGINLSYAMFFNYKYKRCGHLWQDRYKSLIVQKDDYLINCISYIECNPIRAKICQRAEEYPWSSYKARVFGEKNKLIDEITF